MLGQIARFEFNYQRRSPLFWVTFILFFLLAFAGMTIDQVQVGSGGNVLANSPYAISFQHMIWSLFFMFASTAFVANVVVRDDETRFGPILRSTRITKFDYLFGRFAGAFAAAALVLASIPLAIWIGSLMPWLDQAELGPNRLGDYFFAFFLLALPNLFVLSAVFFALATATRSMMWTYLGVVAFFILYQITNSVLSRQPGTEELLAYTEPFGIAAYGLETRYWTSAERNAGNPSLLGYILWNRLIWIGVGLAFLGLAYSLYRFAERGLSARKERKQKRAEERALAEPMPSVGPASLPHASARAPAWLQLVTRTRFEMRQIFRSPAYLVLLLLAAVLVVSNLWSGGEIYGTPSLPRTVLIIPNLTAAFGLISIIIAVYYAGEVVWRERERKMNEIIDATPIANWAFLVPKTLAVILVLFSTVLIGVIVAVLLQLVRGYTDIRLDQYLFWFVLPVTAQVTFTAILAIVVQALSPSKYAGWGIMVLYVILNISLANLGFEHKLYDYGSVPFVPVSDLNGSGGFFRGARWIALYWAAIASIMLVFAHLLWRRGTEARLKPRLARLPRRLVGAPGLIALGGLLVASGAGAFIYRNTNALNEYRTSDQLDRYRADYEKKYLRYERLPQPSVVDVRLAADLYPEETRAEFTGAYTLRNDTAAPIAQVHVRQADLDYDIKSVAIEGGRLASFDEDFGYRIFTLDRPMLPGEARAFRFRTQRWQRGFRNSGYDLRLVRNGTFLNNSEFAPVIGMDRSFLLSDRSKRRKFGLPAELRTPKLEDLSATGKNYIGDWTTAQITVSTSADQTPIAPGKKVSDVTRDGRRTARFVSDAPILNFVSIQSARYAERRRRHNGVDLTIYHHPTHGRNVDRMLDAMEKSLDYLQASYGPYQFDQARIIEFPGYSTFAQSFANTIPYAESFGFAGDFSDPEKIDYATYVTAHELAHQYWGHQISGAEMQGGTMLVETLAQHSALMVMKQLYGDDQIRRFLKFELDSYLRGRTGEALEEVPLGRVENQQYIHYRKGSLAMYLLQQRLGEAAVNRAMSRLLALYKFKGAPYPRSVELIALFREEAKTPEQQALITDLFERIALYDLKVQEPTAVQRADGKWDVTVPVEARKFYADGKGAEKETRLAEAIEIGLFTAEPGRGAFAAKNVIRMQLQPIRSGKQVLKFVTDRKPTHAGVDPYNFYIDRNSEDNVGAVT
ncbi:MAG TPA: M1 family aminopeptidase [Allosphingosinicella sp.]|jgi:ABC-type transport system involved in multi-copper enzyme maturation permease subunit